MQRRVRTAVIPAAGFGTRMLPATRAVPKELLPVGRKPAIEWVIEEATEAGIDWFVVVSSPRKPAIDAYLLGRDDPSMLPAAWPRTAEVRGGNIELIHQPAARGLGDAIRLAHSILGSEPFAVLLPDEILLGGSRLLTTMLEDYARTGQSSVSLLDVPREEIQSYGCARIAPSSFGADRVLITGCVEKPDPYRAPSTLALSGRYVLGSDVLDLLDDVEPDDRGEVQLTPALDLAARKNGLAGFTVREDDGRVDVGNWDGWLYANTRAFKSEQLFAVVSQAGA